jgi:hypothetical protein
MKMNSAKLISLSQQEVDFLIPNLEKDVPLAIDPFLLYKSKNQEFRLLHSKILEVFNEGIRRFSTGDAKSTDEIIDFPEVKEIGLGYGKNTRSGSGLGNYLNQLLIDTLKSSPDLLKRGVKHIEEMQLLSLGIGADRVSDITANILKSFLVDYTQRQCALWEIPIKSKVPLNHLLDLENFEWYDGYFDLPVNTNDEPILLVPRWILRTLPWINFDDYLKAEFSLFLRAKATKSRLKLDRSQEITKDKVVEISRKEIERIDKYVTNKEKDSHNALPAELNSTAKIVAGLGQSLLQSLKQIKPGRIEAAAYQKHILETLNYLFEPELIDGKVEESTIMGTERRDIIFVNDSEKTFFSYLRNSYNNFLIVFETKNTDDLSVENFNQLGTYLGDKTGYCGFLVTRNTADKNDKLKAISIYNNLRRIILILSDQDIEQMINDRMVGKDPMRLLQKRYREFMVSIQ